MRERPILFNGEMVRAILDGRKTQTRISMEPQPRGDIVDFSTRHYTLTKSGARCRGYDSGYVCVPVLCPYGVPGDGLWVRETWQWCPVCGNTEWRADANEHGTFCRHCDGNLGKWKPSIHMFRQDSRIDLKVTGMRVERVQEISALDAMWEGIAIAHNPINRMTIEALGNASSTGLAAIDDFALLWDSINAKRGYSWESNPWVWVLEFEAIQGAADPT